MITQKSTKLRRTYAAITQNLRSHYADFTHPLRRFTQILRSHYADLRRHYADITQPLRNHYAIITQCLRNVYAKFTQFNYAALRNCFTQLFYAIALRNCFTQLLYAIVYAIVLRRFTQLFYAVLRMSVNEIFTQKSCHLRKGQLADEDLSSFPCRAPAGKRDHGCEASGCSRGTTPSNLLHSSTLRPSRKLSASLVHLGSFLGSAEWRRSPEDLSRKSPANKMKNGQHK